MSDNLDSKYVYEKLGKIDANVSHFHDTVKNHKDRLDNHENRISILEDDKKVKQGTSSAISKYLTKTRIAVTSLVAIAASVTAIAYKIALMQPSPEQAKLIQKLEKKADK